jgi:hypothetical protein
MLCRPRINADIGNALGRCYHPFMIASRVLLLGLVALANTAIWAGLLYFGGQIIGISFSARALAGICAFIFVLSLLILAMGGVARSENGNGGDA